MTTAKHREAGSNSAKRVADTDRTDLPLTYISEPKLEFRYGQTLEYPRDGLYLFGPVSDERTVPIVRYGAIGTSEGLHRLQSWAEAVSAFIDVPQPSERSRSIEPHHIPFPGFMQAFGARWAAEPAEIISDISANDVSQTLRIGNRHEAIKRTVELYVDRLIAANNRLENPPSFWFVVIPEEVYLLGRPRSRVVPSERIEGKVTVSRARAKKLEREPTLFGEEEEEAEVYKYATHFRRQLKARLLKDKIVTQIVRETTLAPQDFLNDRGYPIRQIEDPATVAWKLCTAAYYKAGGRPWQLASVRPGVCYVGLVYKQKDPGRNDEMACCAAQMFLSDGDGVVFRGALGPWYSTATKQYHLDRRSARSLMRMVLQEYKRLHDGPPRELFVHARSAFNDEEWRGFSEACPRRTNIVGVQIRDAKDDLKLFRHGAYPVMRGTALKLSERNAYLWTAGFAPRLDTYMGPETPNPVQVKILKGRCDLETVLADVMGLTKINFNSCLHNDRLPVTIRFANAVGEVLISAPIESEPKLPFKYYI